jgi:hypothetical protein
MFSLRWNWHTATRMMIKWRTWRTCSTQRHGYLIAMFESGIEEIQGYDQTTGPADRWGVSHNSVRWYLKILQIPFTARNRNSYFLSQRLEIITLKILYIYWLYWTSYLLDLLYGGPQVWKLHQLADLASLLQINSLYLRSFTYYSNLHDIKI